MNIALRPFLLRVFQLVFLPQKAWNDIRQEGANGWQVFTGYALPLLLISGVADFVFHLNQPDVHINKYAQATIAFFFSALGDGLSIGIAAWFILMFSRNYNLNAIYSMFLKITSYAITTFALVSALVKFFPELSIIYILGFYSFYIFYRGVRACFSLPEGRQTAFVFISILLIVVVFSVVGISINVAASFLFTLI